MNSLQEADYKILKYFDQFAKKNDIHYILYGGTMLGAVRHQGFIPWDDDIDVAMKRNEFEKFEKLFIESDYEANDYIYQSRKVFPYQALPFSKIRSNELNIIERSPTTQKGNYGPWIDIFPYDNVPDNDEGRKEQYKKVNFYNKIIKKFLLVQVEPEDQGIKKNAKKIFQMLNEKLYRFYFFLPYVFRKRHEWMTKYNNEKTKDIGDLSYIYYKEYEHYSKSIIKNSELDQLIKMKFEDSYFDIPKNYDKILKKYYGDYMTLPKESERKVHKIEYSDES